MRKKVKLNVILLMFLLAVLTVLVVLPEKSKAGVTYIPGFAYNDPIYGLICECPGFYGCTCVLRDPFPQTE